MQGNTLSSQQTDRHSKVENVICAKELPNYNLFVLNEIFASQGGNSNWRM